MRIERLILDKIACFDHAEIDIRPGTRSDRADVHLFVGPNGTGKTTALVALSQIANNDGVLASRMTPSSCVECQTDIGAVRWRRPAQVGAKPSAEPPWKARFNLGTIVGLTRKEDPFYEHWERHINGEQVASPDGTSTRRYPFALLAYSGSRELSNAQVSAIREIRANLRHSDLFDPPDAQAVAQWAANARAEVAFATAEGDTAGAARADAVLVRLEQAISRVVGRSFRFVLRRRPIEVLAQVGDDTMPLDLLPDGVKSVLTWLGDLLMRLDRLPWIDDTSVLDRAFVLLLDEIEVHLHPAAQRQVVPMVQTLFPQAQIFLATHSPFVIASAEDAWVHRFRFDGPHVVVDPPIPSQLGRSHEAVLRDLMGVPERFAPVIEESLDALYVARDRVYAGDVEALAEVRRLAAELGGRSQELAAIVTPELRRLERHLGTP